MKIRRRGRRVSVLVGAGELSELGLSFEDFREKRVGALLFLAAVRGHLSADGEGEVQGGIRVSRQGGGVRLTMDAYLPPEHFPSAEDACGRTDELKSGFELYRTLSGYALITAVTDPVEAAKLREHNRLICKK